MTGQVDQFSKVVEVVMAAYLDPTWLTCQTLMRLSE